MTPLKKDLVVLLADTDAKLALEALLKRSQALGIREITFEVIKHPNRDNGCRTKAHELLRPLHNDYDYALVIFDFEGSGGEKSGVESLKTQVLYNLEQNGWAGRAAVVVLNPELEIWVWSNSSHVDRILGWEANMPSLQDWLTTEGWLATDQIKPARPKEAFEAALKEKKQPLSASLFAELAQTVGLRRCEDSSFREFTEILRAWFPTQG